jgi:uncharacterized protein YndB with AHSA1/START domain
MTEEFTMTAIIPAEPEKVYRAWMDSAEHAAFTGSAAEIDNRVGGKFSAWDGYIQGQTLALEPARRILQAWRTTEFPDSSPDSRLEVRFEPVEGGTQLTLTHTAIPDGQGDDYREGWEDYYFTPLTAYFSR